MTYLLVIGNPVDGLTFYGPFKGSDLAMEYVEFLGVVVDWWVTTVEPLNEAWSAAS